MSSISPTGLGAFARVQGAGSNDPAAAPSNAIQKGEDRAERTRRGEDRVEVSDLSRLVARLNELPSVRHELIDRVRSEIAAGTYDTDERLDLALDALIDDTVGLDA